MSVPVQSDGITVYVYARTDVGMRRQGNEDSFLVADLSTGRLGLSPEVATHQLGSNGSLMVVSDGLGGAAAGEVASAMAVQTVCTELMKSAKSILSPSDRLKRATESANEQIWTCAQSDVSLRGMGATLTASFVHGGTVYIAQIGDSRAYMIRGNQVKQVTEDQSWANAVKKAGLETRDVPGTVILQALGTQPKVHVEVTSVDLRDGDSMLLCSDGLSNKVTDVEMREIVRDASDLPDACRQLVELANKRGGEDNVTVIIAQFSGEMLPSSISESTTITSTFKVVQPLDFNEEGDGTDTMNFRPESEGAALSDQVPTLSDLPQLPELPDLTLKGSSRETGKLSDNAPTSPLTGKALPRASATDALRKPPSIPENKPTSKLEGNLFSPPPNPEIKTPPSAVSDLNKKAPPKSSSFVDTKPDLPMVPLPEVKPIAERKSEPKTGKLPNSDLNLDLDLNSLPELKSPPLPPLPTVGAPKPNKPSMPPLSAPPPPQSRIPAPPPPSPTLFTSNPGLFFTPVESPSPPSKIKQEEDDDIEPLMFETLSILPEEKGKTNELPPKAEIPISAPPPPAAPPKPPASAGDKPSFPKLETLQPQISESSKLKLSGPEVLASLFSAPPAKTESPTAPLSSPKSEPPMLEPSKAELPKLELSKLEPPRQEPKTEPLKPAVPPLVMPKGSDAKPSSPPTGGLPPFAPPPKAQEPIPGRLYIEDLKSIEPPPAAQPPRPSPPTGGLASKTGTPPRPESLPSSIFSPPTKPLPTADAPAAKPPFPPKSAEPPSTSPLKSAIPPVQPPRAEPPKAEPPRPGPPKTDFAALPPVPPLQQAPPVRTPPVQAAPPPKPTGATGSLKQTTGSLPRDSAKSVPPPMRAAATPSSAFGSSISKEPRKLNPKLLMGIGGALVVIVLGIVAYGFFSGGQETAVQPLKKEQPPVQTQPVEPQQTNPAVQNPPDKPVDAASQTTPSPTTPEENVPTDTAGLVKFSLDEVKKTIERVKKELPESDPRKESFMQRLNAFERELNGYSSTGRADDEARGYAESARSQIKSVRQQLDKLPNPKGRK